MSEQEEVNLEGKAELTTQVLKEGLHICLLHLLVNVGCIDCAAT